MMEWWFDGLMVGCWWIGILEYWKVLTLSGAEGWNDGIIESIAKVTGESAL